MKDGIEVWGEYTEGFKTNYAIECLRYHKEMWYMLRRSQLDEWVFHKTDQQCFDWKLKSIWKHRESIKRINQFVILNDTIYAPNRSTKTICQYTLNGMSAGKGIPVELAPSNTFICATPTGELVISQTSPPLLVCVDPISEQTLWLKTDLSCPQALTADYYSRTSPILVYSENMTTKSTYLDVRAPDTGG